MNWFKKVWAWLRPVAIEAGREAVVAAKEAAIDTLVAEAVDELVAAIDRSTNMSVRDRALLKQRVYTFAESIQAGLRRI